MDKIVIQQQDFDINTEIKLAKGDNSSVGAIVSFVGLVRDFEQEKITKMTIEHYHKMTEKHLKSIVKQAKKRWQINNTTIIHRIGNLLVNDKIVLVITTSKHRKAAFAACEFIIDYLKTEATFWKKEHYLTKSRWVEKKISDVKQKNKWTQSKV